MSKFKSDLKPIIILFCLIIHPCLYIPTSLLLFISFSDTNYAPYMCVHPYLNYVSCLFYSPCASACTVNHFKPIPSFQSDFHYLVVICAHNRTSMHSCAPIQISLCVCVAHQIISFEALLCISGTPELQFEFKSKLKSEFKSELKSEYNFEFKSELKPFTILLCVIIHLCLCVPTLSSLLVSFSDTKYAPYMCVYPWLNRVSYLLYGPFTSARANHFNPIPLFNLPLNVCCNVCTQQDIHAIMCTYPDIPVRIHCSSEHLIRCIVVHLKSF
ncbi:hypothetical protein Sjap_018002 [Stephania japonica]|uniref:Uncharacterized protein n=1 Tax=Stephania japonica TaxID=461633 RepID=A0AAP0NIW3_9MAGN